ncbi:hypothetical protein BABINDRAFT_39542 [Babjeviella inositovora NRRL Y-12698]|uniref:Condensin complex subunit 2 n=1 Tax=Babjeviella inositovora NRRL Y-12698 TaxID=984486 RepID=A0A1E3QLN8_9ASCO|nr:uncharacterized protein BABINDRAFT_39542 [Babjeviella inositovora NRRL Y-12698]ODQ78603.1 hypothetical protein BABINDRAFT_39542 [Babjeviella inositovora NRRL Y-12698]
MENFEEWIKLATDNKINSTNSWNVALIDYFHDLRVLTDGDNNINFQKALATLDGCVKIYLSRVDSVATETGKLLTGLSTKKQHEASEAAPAEEDEEDEEGEEGEDDPKAKKTSRRNLSNAKTLVEFEALRLKVFEKELTIDPLFKKALAEFDEGGAKSLLLNTLAIDSDGRVVFDATTQQMKREDEIDEAEGGEIDEAEVKSEEIALPVDISNLKYFLYNTPAELDTYEVCSQLRALERAAEDPRNAKVLLEEMQGEIDVPVDQDSDNDYQDFDMGFENVSALPADAEKMFDDDSDGNVSRASTGVGKVVPDGTFDEAVDDGVVANIIDHDLMAYFDLSLKNNWRGAEHWRVSAIKNRGRKEPADTPQEGSVEPRKKKEKLVINFLEAVALGLDEDDEEDVLFEIPKLKHMINMTKKEQADMTKEKNILPVDIQFSSVQLTKLGLKPHVNIAVFAKQMRIKPKVSSPEPVADENFFAAAYDHPEVSPEPANDEIEDDFNQDFDMGQAFEDPPDSQPLNALLGRKVRPEYVNYARTAKKVDVKLLKDNIWSALATRKSEEVKEETQFSDVVRDITKFYAPEARKDLSTSFCFICVLHLANEHGLTITNNDELTDMAIQGLESVLIA